MRFGRGRRDRWRRPGRFLAGGLLLCALGLGAWACAGDGGSDQASEDTLTRRQKDSILSTLPIPGAGAVEKALEASDAARARAEAHDTIGGGTPRP